MSKYGLAILGLSETKKKGTGEYTLRNNYKFLYSGPTEGRAKKGVGFVIRDDIEKLISDWEHKIIIMGDWNGRIGNNMNKGKGTMGKFGGEGITNKNGKRMMEFCIFNNILIGNTFFPHKKSHQITFKAEGTGAETIIDYITYTNDTRYNIMDVRVFRGAELSTDHYLLVVKYRCKLFHKKNNNKPFTKIRTRTLEDKEKRELYRRTVTKKLENLDLHANNITLEEKWVAFKQAIIGTAEEVCGEVKQGQRMKRTPWWNEKVKEAVKEKRRLGRNIRKLRQKLTNKHT